MARFCEKCSTPLDDAGHCVTCEADGEGLKILSRREFAVIREMMAHLETEGLAPEMEKVPPVREHEKVQPLWNLYVPEAELQRAVELLKKHWAELLDAPDAAAAAARGEQVIDLAKGGEVACPACGHTFTVSGADAECPECGLGLGVPESPAPDEAQSS
jgi:rubrerythrin